MKRFLLDTGPAQQFINKTFGIRQAAAEFGRLFTLLKQMGRPMQQIDIQVAAIALTLGNCTVVSANSDLSAIPGLSVENWATSHDAS